MDDNNGNNSGSAYVFKRTGSSWTEEAKLIPSDGAAGDEFGWSVSVSGDYAVVGAFGDDDNGENSGSAFVYSGIIVGIDDEIAGLSAEFSLSQNYPNPFNSETVLRYTLPNSSNLSLVIYNIIGQEIMRWDEQSTLPGYYEKTWNGTNKFGVPVGSGVYLYRLIAGDFVETHKMVLLK